MSELSHTREAERTKDAQRISESLRLPLGQLVVMVILVAFFSAVPAFVTTGILTLIFPETPRWYALFIAPGLFLFALLSRSRHLSSLSNGESWLVFALTHRYYFGLLFAFVFWADRRWRRKRAARGRYDEESPG